MRRVFFHIHTWKTGGTTFLNTCRKNFGKAFHRDVMLVQDWTLTVEQISWLLSYHEWLRCYSCHMLSGNLPYGQDGTEIIGLAFVRNPVDRYISNFNFQMKDSYRGGFAKGKTFDEYCIQSLGDKNNRRWRNGQTYVLSGKSDMEGLAIIEEHFQKGQIVPLVTERFDESCIVLEKMFPNDFKDCSYVRKNVSSHKTPINDQQRQLVEKYMDFDLKLHEMANIHLDKTLGHLFPSWRERQAYMDGFKLRCHIRKRNQMVFQSIKSVEKALRGFLYRRLRH